MEVPALNKKGYVKALKCRELKTFFLNMIEAHLKTILTPLKFFPAGAGTLVEGMRNTSTERKKW